MLPVTNFNRTGARRRTSHHPVKLTALLCLKQALLDERYEDCALAVEIAREFGAEDFEVQDLLEDPRRNPT